MRTAALALAALSLALAGCTHGYILDEFTIPAADGAKPQKRKVASVRTLCDNKADCAKITTPPVAPPKAEPPKPKPQPQILKADKPPPNITPEEAEKAQKHIDELIKIFGKGQS